MASEKSAMAVIRAYRPFFRNEHDKIAFAIHATFLVSDYVLTSAGPPALSNSALSSPSSDEVGIEHWNELDDDNAFVYEKGSKKVLVKCCVMNDKLLVDALAEGGSEPVHLEINVGHPFRNKHDYFASVIHANFLASGYVLMSTGPPAFSDSALSSPSSDEVGIEHWNELDDDYAFAYVNPEKGSKKVLVKCHVKNDKLLVDALAEGGSDPVHLEINVGDYVEENPGNNYSGQYKNLEKLVKSLEAEILSKLDGSSSTGSLSDKPSSSEAREGSRRNLWASLAFPKFSAVWFRSILFKPVLLIISYQLCLDL